LRSFLEEGRVHEAKAAPSRTYLFLHPHNMTEKKTNVFQFLVGLQPFYFSCQVVDALHAYEGHRGIKHHVHRSRDGFFYDLLYINGVIDLERIVHETLRGQGPPGEAGILKILRPDPDGMFKNGIAYEKFFPIPSVDDEIMRVKLKTHFRRKVWKPVY